MILIWNIEVYILIYLIAMVYQQPPPKNVLCKSMTSKLFELESWGGAQIEALFMQITELI